MLELRPICEHCACNLPPDSTEARICSFECTFCRRCVEEQLLDVCPNCGGGFTPRPIRPTRNLRNHNNLSAYPALTTPLHRPVDIAAHQAWARQILLTPPEQR